MLPFQFQLVRLYFAFVPLSVERIGSCVVLIALLEIATRQSNSTYSCWRLTLSSLIASRSLVASSARSFSSSSIFLFSRSFLATVRSSSSISLAWFARRTANSSEALVISLRASRSVFWVFWRSCWRSVCESWSEFTACQLASLKAAVAYFELV